jgi:aminopeptidase N
MDVVDVDAIHQVREYCRQQLAQQLQDELMTVYQANQSNEYEVTAEAMGQRSLKNVCLAYLMTLNNQAMRDLAMAQYQTAQNMTDQIAALRALTHTECAERDEVLVTFYEQWKDDALVIDKWFIAQATAALADTPSRIRQLLEHEAFDIRVPNRVRALIGAFSQSNPLGFHDASGDGYRILADTVMQLNTLNPQIAARLSLPLIQWRRYDESRQNLMKQQLKRLSELPDLAKDVFEIVSRGLDEH